MSTGEQMVFLAVIGGRFLLPLLIPRVPLPAILACLVLDAADQTIFQKMGYNPPGYQSYDKAMDVYYLAVAYLSMLRNWASIPAFRVGWFLYFYRLIGVVAFELSHVRALLLIFPNTFEYFFDAYEGIRSRWRPTRWGLRWWIGVAAIIWIFIKLPQEWWIHVAQLDATDLIKEKIFGVAKDASWAEAFAARPMVLIVVGVAIIVFFVVAWWVITRKLPPADREPTFDADKNQPMVDSDRIDRMRKQMATKVVDRELIEKIVLVGLVSIIFGRMLPGVEASPLGIAVGVAVVIVVNGWFSDYLIRRARTLGYHTATRQFLGTLIVNVVIVEVGQLILDVLHGPTLQHALVFVLLLSLIVTLYDRYRPIHVTRFDGERGPSRLEEPR
jgi:hypothetical protein